MSNFQKPDSWFDIHPKVVGIFFLVVALIVIAIIVAIVDPDLWLGLKEHVLLTVGALLALVVGYFKPVK